MDLLSDVTETMDLDRGTAARALGVIFAAVRMTMDPDGFASVQRAFPDVNDWLRGEGIGLARTGEMMGVIGEKAMRRGLSELGLRDPQADALCELVGRRLGEKAPDVARRAYVDLPSLIPSD